MNHRVFVHRLKPMRQKLYMAMRSLTSLWAERAKTSRMTTMATYTFFENVKQNHPLTSHQSLRICSQVKADATETPHKNAFANIVVSRARENIKDDHDDNMDIFWTCQTTKPLTSHQSWLLCSKVKADATETLYTNARANVIVSRTRENIKDGHDGNMNIFWTC